MLTALRKWNRVGHYRISLVLFLFCLLFSPPIIPHVNTGAVACGIALFLLILRFRTQCFAAAKQSGALLFGVCFLFFLLYLALTTLCNTALIGERVQLLHYLKLWYRLFLVCPLLLAASVYLLLRFRALQTTPRQVCGYLIAAVLFQFVLVLISLLFPTVKTAFTTWIYRQTGDSYLNIPWVMARRGFGFANSFVDSFGWGMGLVAAIPLFLVQKKNPWPLLLCPILLFVSLVNARTGLVVFCIGLLFFFLFLFRTYRHSTRQEKRNLLFAVLGAVGILLLLCLLLYAVNPITLQWILGDLVSFVPQEGAPSALQEVLEHLADDSETTTAEVLFSAGFWNLPTGFPLFFGAGHTLYGAAGYAHSDVGYVNDLWMGGLLGCLLLYAGFFLLFWRALRTATTDWSRFLLLFLGISMAVFQIKATAISFCAGMNLTLPLLLVFGYRQPSAPPFPTDCRDRVSVIVPVYRVEAELPRCVQSIREQTYPYLEILLIDDGSPDGCPTLCDAFAVADSRIRVIHQSNSGLSAARNTGIEAATGAYLAFVDGDDFLHPDFIATLLSACKTQGTALAAVGHIRYFGRWLQIASQSGGNRVFSAEQAVQDLFAGQHTVDVMAWNKLYRADLFAEDIRYPIGRIHEDVATTYRLLHRAKQIAFVDLPYYFYRQRRGSIVHRPFSNKRMDLLELVAEIEPFVSAHPIYREAYRFYVFYNHLTLLHAMLEQGAEKNSILALRNATLQLYASLRREQNPFLSKKQRFGMLLCKQSLWLYTEFRRWHRRFSFALGVLT